jgi:hypothetical protein
MVISSAIATTQLCRDGVVLLELDLITLEQAGDLMAHKEGWVTLGDPTMLKIIPSITKIWTILWWDYRVLAWTVQELEYPSTEVWVGNNTNMRDPFHWLVMSEVELSIKLDVLAIGSAADLSASSWAVQDKVEESSKGEYDLDIR